MNDNNFFNYSREFDDRFRYDGKDLGVRCAEGRTVFKVWSPFAESVELRLYRDAAAQPVLKREMQNRQRGIWEQEFQESLHGMYYDYLVRSGGKEVRTADPYAVSCSCNGEKSMVLDLRLTDPPGFSLDSAPPKGQEQIIYELHIKDFSYDENSGIPQKLRGKYKAFTVAGEDGTEPVCIRHLKELGITHVHLLPFFDYGSVDEAGDGSQFNWGYDPYNYNVPEGSYATDPQDGAVRVRECKEMIQALHAMGIRVVMDVVYNHTYRTDSWLQRMAPGYYYRHMEDGSLANGSDCGNDIAAGRAMADNYIADSVLYWAREYHIDGFRFDLMGLLTVELMNRIRRELDEEFGVGEKLMYGEPWSAFSSPMEEGMKPALKENASYLDNGIGIFSDDTRDAIKGSVFQEKEPGFVNGGSDLEQRILHAVTGWKDGGACFVPKSCEQIINYVSAHDNFSLWDKLVLSMHRGTVDFTEPYEDVMAANKLAAFIYFTCQGSLFMQAGEEFGRTKFGEDNSYCSAPEINMLRWEQAARFGDLVEYYKGLIRLRKSLPGLCDKSPAAAQRVTQKRIYRDGVVSFRVDNKTAYGREEWEELLIVYNASPHSYTLELPQAEGGGWTILADGSGTDCRKSAAESVEIEGRSGMMLARGAS